MVGGGGDGFCGGGCCEGEVGILVVRVGNASGGLDEGCRGGVGGQGWIEGRKAGWGEEGGFGL